MYYIPAIIVIIGILVFWIIQIQRSLVILEDNNTKAMSQIGVQVSSQWEVLNFLLNISKEHTAQGYETIIEMMKARHSITKDSLPEDFIKQENLIEEIINKIIDIAHENPAVKVEQAYIKGMEAIDQYKKMVETSKLIYDDSVKNFNREIYKFPTILIARILGFSNRQPFGEDK